MARMNKENPEVQYRPTGCNRLCQCWRSSLMKRLKSLQLGFILWCSLTCRSLYLQADEHKSFILQVSHSFFFFPQVFFHLLLTMRWTSEITWKRSFFLPFSPKRQLLKGWHILFHEKNSEPSCPLDVKLHICVLFILPFFRELRELQKNPKMVQSTFDVTRDKFCNWDWCKVCRKWGEKLMSDFISEKHCIGLDFISPNWHSKKIFTVFLSSHLDSCDRHSDSDIHTVCTEFIMAQNSDRGKARDFRCLNYHKIWFI